MSGRGWMTWYPLQEKRYAVVVMTEEHLPEKWLREVKHTVPLVYAAIARRPEEVLSIPRTPPILLSRGSEQRLGPDLDPGQKKSNGSGTTDGLA